VSESNRLVIHPTYLRTKVLQTFVGITLQIW